MMRKQAVTEIEKYLKTRNNNPLIQSIIIDLRTGGTCLVLFSFIRIYDKL